MRSEVALAGRLGGAMETMTFFGTREAHEAKSKMGRMRSGFIDYLGNWGGAEIVERKGGIALR